MDETSENGTTYTLDDVYELVANGFDGLSSTTSDGFDLVGGKLDHIQSSEGSTSSGTVVLDQAQLDLLQDGIAVITTESFLLVVLLAALCGLVGWQIFSRGWFR